MVDLESRVQKAIEDITGNEALLEMLDTEAASEMLEWGKSMVHSLVKQTSSLDDAAAEQELDTRLKAVRQFMRSVGNWAAGRYADPADRLPLREKLVRYQKAIQGENAHLPPGEQLDALLNEVDDKRNTPLQLILKLKELFDESH